MSILGGYIGPMVNAATTAVTGYEMGQRANEKTQKEDSLRQYFIKRQQHQDEVKDAVTTGRMRSMGYVPDSERDPNGYMPDDPSTPPKPLRTEVPGGFGDVSMEPPTMNAPRYGESVGGFTYDNASPSAEEKRQKVADIVAQRKQRESAGRVPDVDLRERMIAAGNDPDDVDAVLATHDPVAIRNLLKPPAARTPRAPNPNAEPPAHRDARQAAVTVRGQIKDTQGQIGTMNRSAPPLVQFPGIATGSAADSASARDFTTRRAGLQQRADSLRAVGDQLAGKLTGAAGGSAGGVLRGAVGVGGAPVPMPTHRTPLRDSMPVAGVGSRVQEARLYQRAIETIRRDFAGDPQTMTRQLQAAQALYNKRMQDLGGPQE